AAARRQKPRRTRRCFWPTPAQNGRAALRRDRPFCGCTAAGRETMNEEGFMEFRRAKSEDIAVLVDNRVEV
ncbi:MAG: hypothetical protein LIO58_02020, partial [Oscillospiraceae bacterium]|nr:hypothetical protein [Oscillospiraceae bacterium]